MKRPRTKPAVRKRLDQTLGAVEDTVIRRQAPTLAPTGEAAAHDMAPNEERPLMGSTDGSDDDGGRSDEDIDKDPASAGVDFGTMRGVGEDSDGSDSDEALEVMAVKDLPGQVIKTHRVDNLAMERKLVEMRIFADATTSANDRALLDFTESLCIPMSITTPLPSELAQDDLQRESRFAELATESVHAGLSKLRRLHVKFRRPSDYFAEMVKNDQHMTKVKSRLLHEKERIELAQKNRNNRDLRKNRKKVRQEQMESDQRKRQNVKQEIEAVSKMNKERLRRRSKGRDNPDGEGIDNDDDDDFPVHLLDVEEVKDPSRMFVREKPRRPKANVGRKGDRNQTRGRDDDSVGSHPRDRDAQRNGRRMGPNGGIKKNTKLGSKKRPGKSRRVKGKARS